MRMDVAQDSSAEVGSFERLRVRTVGARILLQALWGALL